MKLQRVKIENFRSIKSESFDLGSMALLVGANNKHYESHQCFL